jgi:hypothetical protein
VGERLGKVKTIGLAVFLLIVIAFPFVLGFAFMRPGSLRLFSMSGAGTSGTASVFVTPQWVVQDYTSLPIGSKFSVKVNVSSVTDLYTFQLNFTWNHAILNASRITAGDFLLRTTSSNKTASYQLGFVMNQTDNTKGYSGMSDSVLTSVSGVTGSGCLVSIQFLVVGYGATGLNISSTGNLATSLLNSAGTAITFTTTNGYFDNRIPGDITGSSGVPDRKVDIYDLGYVGKAFGSSDPIADFTGASGYPDGKVDIYDLGACGKNFGRSV